LGVVPEVICTDLDGNSEVDIEKEILACEKALNSSDPRTRE